MYESVKMLTNDRVRMLFSNSTPQLVRRTTSKCLFGVPDPVETNKLFEEQIIQNRLNCMQRWNFDVYTSEPANLPGGLHWVAGNDDLSSSSSSPSDEETPRDDDCCHGNTEKVRQPHQRGTGVRTGRVQRPSHQQRQIKMTEMWPIKKKSLSSQVKKLNGDDI